MSDTPELKMWLAIRTDLGMSPGKIAVQAAHAATHLQMRAHYKIYALFMDYMRSSTAKVAVRVDTELALRRVAAEAEKAGLLWYVVHDAGRTEIAAGSPTVCAFGPAYRADLPPYLKRLQLFEGTS